MTILRKQGLWLCVPPIVFCLFDAAVTLYGQSAAYWMGDYQIVEEMSPTPRYWLQIHPLVFVAGTGGWILTFSAIILLLPETLALSLAMMVCLGHLVCGNCWVMWRMPNGYFLGNAIFVVASFVLVLMFKRGQNGAGNSVIDWQRTGLPGWMRWATIACLALIPIYLFLIPR